MRRDILLFTAAALGMSCGGQAQAPGEPASPGPAAAAPAAPEKTVVPPARDRAAVYASVRLTPRISRRACRTRSGACCRC